MSKPFVLIVEDDRDIAALFQHALDLAGFWTEVVFHGEDAIERLTNCQPDIVILDLNLPGISGNRILKLIRKDGRLNQTKVIVVSAHAHVVDDLSIQPDLVLLKPVSIEQLTSLVGRIILQEKSSKAIPMHQEPLESPYRPL